MSVTHEDIQELKKVFDDRYVLQTECNDIQTQNSKKFANDDKRIDLILQGQNQMREETHKGLKFNNWLTTAVLSVIIVGIVTFIYFNFGR